MHESQQTDGSFWEALDAVGWVDLTAGVILLVFLVAGLFHGALWQISRIAILVLSYGLSAAFGGQVGAAFAGWLDTGPGEDLPLYLGFLTVFVGVLVLLGLLAWLLRRAFESEEGRSALDRVGGGLLGLLTGSLVVMALLTGVHMLARGTGVGNSIVEAADKSQSVGIAADTLEFAASVLPDGWEGGPEAWRELLGASDGR